MKLHKSTLVVILCAGLFLCCLAASVQAQGKSVIFPGVSERAVSVRPKISATLLQGLEFVKGATKEQKSQFEKIISPQSPPPFRFDDLGRIQCNIKCTDLSPSTLKEIKKAGVEIHLTDASNGIIQTWLSGEQIKKLESLPEVRMITTPNYPVANVGSVTTEGYAALRIDEFINRPEFAGSNVTGRNIKVGVLSTAIDQADDSQEINDLPEDGPFIPNIGIFGGIYYFSWRTNPGTGDPYGDDEEAIRTWFGSRDQEGTAMLEIIHDIVPDAELYFANFDTDLEMNMAKDWLRQMGCDVIVDDIGFLNAGPYDGTSTVSLGSSRQVENGVAYYTSVGNQAQRHWWGYFNDPEKNDILNYKPDDETIEVSVPGGSILQVIIAWDEPWGYSGYDIDLYLLDPNFLNINSPIAYSTTLQQGDGDPEEGVAIINLGAQPAIYSIVVARKERPNGYDDSNPMRVNMFMFGCTVTEPRHIVAAGSILNNSDAGGGVISVGAIDVSSRLHNVVEPFSSRGPTWDGRLKPEIACFDGTSSGQALSDTPFATFFGTSAAAPHCAAFAAMIKGYKVSEGDPDFTNPSTPKALVSSINNEIFIGAEDMLPVGVSTDYMSGYGRTNAENTFINFLEETGRRAIYNFESGADGWTFGASPGLFTEPGYKHENGRLELQSKDGNTFGFWQSPQVVFNDGSIALNPDKLYQVRFRVMTLALPDAFPGFRLRANGGMSTVASTKLLSPKTGQNHAPDDLGVDYYLWIDPTLTEQTNGVSLAFDLVQIGDPSTETLFLDEVEIVEYDQPTPSGM